MCVSVWFCVRTGCVNVFEYGRTRARKSVFRICQKRMEFTNTLASCLRFENYQHRAKLHSDHLFSLSCFSCTTTRLIALFSHTFHTKTGASKSNQPFPYCSLVSFCSFESHCCWDSLTCSLFTDRDHTRIALTLHPTEFSTRLLRPKRKLFHFCYFFFLPNRGSWPFFLRRNRQIYEILTFFTKFQLYFVRMNSITPKIRNFS